MANPYFQFKQFTIYHDRCAMKVTTDACLFGAWVAGHLCQSPRSPLLDIGAGTGLLSLMVAQKTGAEIDAIEIDPEAAGQAGENISSSPWGDRIKLVKGDVRKMRSGKLYEVIFSNPPFYEQDLRSGRGSRDTAHHSTDLKLHELLGVIGEQLYGEGLFFLLLPFRRKEEALQLVGKAGLYAYEVVQVCPSVQHPPFRIMLMGGKVKKDGLRKHALAIKGGDGAYTPEFTELLKNYYLYLPS